MLTNRCDCDLQPTFIKWRPPVAAAAGNDIPARKWWRSSYDTCLLLATARSSGILVPSYCGPRDFVNDSPVIQPLYNSRPIDCGLEHMTHRKASEQRLRPDHGRWRQRPTQCYNSIRTASTVLAVEEDQVFSMCFLVTPYSISLSPNMYIALLRAPHLLFMPVVRPLLNLRHSHHTAAHRSNERGPSP